MSDMIELTEPAPSDVNMRDEIRAFPIATAPGASCVRGSW